MIIAFVLKDINLNWTFVLDCRLSTKEISKVDSDVEEM